MKLSIISVFLCIFFNPLSAQKNYRNYFDLKNKADFYHLQRHTILSQGGSMQQGSTDRIGLEFKLDAQRYEEILYTHNSIQAYLDDKNTLPSPDDLFAQRVYISVDQQNRQLVFAPLSVNGAVKDSLPAFDWIFPLQEGNTHKAVLLVPENNHWFQSITFNQEVWDYITPYIQSRWGGGEIIGGTIYYTVQHGEREDIGVMPTFVYKVVVYPEQFDGEPILELILSPEDCPSPTLQKDYDREVVHRYQFPQSYSWLDGSWKYRNNGTDYRFTFKYNQLEQHITEDSGQSYEKSFVYSKGKFTKRTASTTTLHFPYLMWFLTEEDFGMKEFQLSDVTNTRPQSLIVDTKHRTLVYADMKTSEYLPLEKIKPSSYSYPPPSKKYVVMINQEGIVSQEIINYPHAKNK